MELYHWCQFLKTNQPQVKFHDLWSIVVSQLPRWSCGAMTQTTTKSISLVPACIVRKNATGKIPSGFLKTGKKFNSDPWATEWYYGEKNRIMTPGNCHSSISPYIKKREKKPIWYLRKISEGTTEISAQIRDFKNARLIIYTLYCLPSPFACSEVKEVMENDYVLL